MALETCLILGQVSHNLLYWKKNLQKDTCGPGERLTKRQVTSRPDHVWPELWRGLARNAKLREKNEWAIEKPKLDNAGRLRGIVSLTLRTWSSRKSLGMLEKRETLMAPAMPCKTCKKSKHRETRSKTNDFKSKFACILEASESTKMQMEESSPYYHEDLVVTGHVQHIKKNRPVSPVMSANMKRSSATHCPNSGQRLTEAAGTGEGSVNRSQTVHRTLSAAWIASSDPPDNLMALAKASLLG